MGSYLLASNSARSTIEISEDCEHRLSERSVEEYRLRQQR